MLDDNRPPLLVRLRFALGDAWERIVDLAARLLWPLERAAHHIAAAAADAVERFERVEVALAWLAWLARPVWYPLAATLGFTHAWLVSRNYRQLLWGLPALVLLLPLAPLALQNKEQVAAQYYRAVQQALETNDYPRAELFERKLAQLGVATPRDEFRTAVTLANDGRLEEAFARMQRIAPAERPGYPRAHHWIVQQLLRGSLELPADETQRLLTAHLAHLDTLGFRGPELQLVQAMLLTQQDRLAEAAQKLEPLAHRRPDAAALRLRIDLSADLPEEVRRDARFVRELLAEKSRRGEPLTGSDYQAWCVAEELLGNQARLEMLLREWRALEPQRELPARALAELRLRQFDEHLDAENPDAERLADSLGEAAELGAPPRTLAARAAKLYRRQPELTAARRAIERLAAAPETGPLLLETWGTLAAADQRWEEAQTWLRRAVERDPRRAPAWNNLAWALAHGGRPDLAAALAAAERAIDLAPGDSRLLETRGQILAALGRWPEAAADLELALNGMPGAPDVHHALATAYEQLGEEEIAQSHRERARGGGREMRSEDRGAREREGATNE